MALLSLATIRRLLGPHRPPCLSLLMPTHRRVPARIVDRHQFRHLVDDLEADLEFSESLGETRRLLEPFRRLQSDAEFWEHTLDGLVMFGSDGTAEVFCVQYDLPPLAVVRTRFHTMPLVRAFSEIDRFDLLALTSRQGRVYSGTLQGLDPVDLETGCVHGGIDRWDLIDQESIEPHRVRASLGQGRTLHGGYRDKQEGIDADTERFFREVDRIVDERVSRVSGLPLILVALAEQAAVFRRGSRNVLLLDEGVHRDPKPLKPADFPLLVEPIFAASRQRRIERLLDRYEAAFSHGRASGDPAGIARAVVAGRVATLLVEADRYEEGIFDRASGAIRWGEGLEPRSGVELAGDLFGILAEEVLLHGGEVVSLEKSAVPGENGLAAIERF